MAGVATIVTAPTVVKSSPSVLIFATLDTKGREAAYIRDLLNGWGVATTLVDVGSLAPPIGPARRHSGTDFRVDRHRARGDGRPG